MGHPRRITKKYSTPKHPWRAERILEESRLEKEYGLKNKKEIWKAHAYLRDIRRQARKLLALRTKQSEIERTQLINRLVRLGLLKADAGIDDILALTTTDILNRRLQTLVYKAGLATTINQARQFIVHGHVAIAGQRVTAPSYLVRSDEEKEIEISKDVKISAPAPKTKKTAVKKAIEAETAAPEGKEEVKSSG